MRLAGSEDAAAMHALVRRSYAHYVVRIGQPPRPMSMDYNDVVARGDAWLLERQGNLLGLIVFRGYPDHLWVENVAVSPDSQGLGIGSHLLDFASETALERGLSELRLCTNVKMTENLEFYPRRGFIETHRAHEDGMDRVFFAKHLTPRG